LRQRQEDLIYLARRFLDLTNRELNKSVLGFSEPAIRALLHCPWPGNVRQLRSTIRRAVLLAGEVVTEEHLDILQENSGAWRCAASAAPAPGASAAVLSLKEIVAQSTAAVERGMLLQTLRQTGGNKAKAARLLQVDYKTIQSKIKHYGISSNGATL
ncbi:MAG: helix-turn-helix domain-containing protein, partial [Limisphaerales bacterium]